MHEEEENNEIEEEFSMSYNNNNTTGKVFFILLWIVVGLACVMLFYMGLLYYVKKENEFVVDTFSNLNPKRTLKSIGDGVYLEMMKTNGEFVSTGNVILLPRKPRRISK